MTTALPGDPGASAPAGPRESLPTASARETWRAARGLLGRYRARTAGAFATLLAASTAGLAVPWLLGRVVDAVTVRDGRAVAVLVAALVVVGLVTAALTHVSTRAVAALGERLLADLRERVLDRALHQPIRRVERAGTGDLVARVSGDVRVVADAASQVLPGTTGAALTIGVTLAGLGLLDWRFSVAALVAVPVQVFATVMYVRRTSPMYRATRAAEAARTQRSLDALVGAETVRAFGIEEHARTAVDRASRDYVDHSLRAARSMTRFYGRLNVAELLGLGSVLVVGFVLVRDDAATLGAATAAALYFHRLFGPINTLLGGADELQRAGAGLARLVGVLELPDAAAGGAGADPEHGQPGRGIPDRARAAEGATVRLRGVRFAYDGADVLHGVDLDVAPGEHVALVGPSGSGKSTIARLVGGIEEPRAGSVTVDGAPPRTGPGGDVALVTQDVHVFAGTLADDLRLARPDATDDDLWDALRTVGAARWVRALPDGLATGVGTTAHPLGGDRAQQLALARLRLRDPRVAVLDEATAEAGSRGARVLDAAVAAVARGRTCVVVAHRLSQAVNADRVAYVADGRVVEQGTHAELVAAGGRYAHLWSTWSAGRDAGRGPGADI
ncbi:ABC transporter ATP-binding protein [Cellulosimicrobium cellulans]|uniref:ABC transporter ATP-binding protein n=1 Tax=Cellulosimicrobium cellulans TaxID=1710 RepID=UPI0024075DCF|nr:ABC transporter ATP-binding protein [Cellulosimicrobium cellulans]MDF9875561.1 ATP-binding cassette subfamily C protein [Cellulosimicrobium cellulans]